MSRRALTLLASVLASGLVGGLANTARADCTDTPITINFDAGSGMPHCYTESGLTVCAFDVLNSEIMFPSALALGDNDGDTSPDLMNYDNVSGTRVYTFDMGGAPFAVTGFNFVHFSGEHTFRSSKSELLGTGDLDYLSSSQTVTTDPTEWSGITSFTWTADDGDDAALGAVIDELEIVAQCCGNGVVDTGEQCDDGNTLGNDDNGDCCSATCQYEANGLFCYPSDGNICTADTCDGAGTCAALAIPNCDLTRPCGPIRPAGNPAFEHPKKSSIYKVSLVQGFVDCGNVGGNSPNGTTEGGIPACIGPETPNERAGSPTNGWQWDEGVGRADIQIKRICAHASDAAVKLKMTGIVDGNDAPATSDGSLALTLRMTVDDPSNGDMTTVNVIAQLPLTAFSGKAALVTTIGVMLSEGGMPDIPNGSSIEVVDIQVLDPNGNLFAHPGVFLPE